MRTRPSSMGLRRLAVLLATAVAGVDAVEDLAGQ